MMVAAKASTPSTLSAPTAFAAVPIGTTKYKASFRERACIHMPPPRPPSCSEGRATATTGIAAQWMPQRTGAAAAITEAPEVIVAKTPEAVTEAEGST